MTAADFLDIQPSELKFPFEVKKQSSASIQLTNKIDQCVAFKVKTTNPRGYCVRPNAGVVLPNSTCNISVTMQAQDNPPLDMHCKDKFLIQSAVVPSGTQGKDVTQEMFNAEEGKVIGEARLKVIYVPANNNSLSADGADEEGTSLGTSSAKDDMRKSSISDVAWNVVSRLNDENDSLIKQNHRLVTQLELMRKSPGQGQGQGKGVPRALMLLGLLLGILMGYFIPK